MVKSQYDVHPGVAMVQNWVATLREKTGRSLEGAEEQAAEAEAEAAAR